MDTHQGRRRLWVAARGDERLVFCDGQVHVLDLPDPDHADEEDAGRRRPRPVRRHARQGGQGPGEAGETGGQRARPSSSWNP